MYCQYFVRQNEKIKHKLNFCVLKKKYNLDLKFLLTGISDHMHNSLQTAVWGVYIVYRFSLSFQRYFLLKKMQNLTKSDLSVSVSPCPPLRVMNSHMFSYHHTTCMDPRNNQDKSIWPFFLARSTSLNSRLFQQFE